MKVKVYYPATVCAEVEVDDKFAALPNQPEFGNAKQYREHQDLIDEFVKAVGEQIDEIRELDDLHCAYDSNDNLLIEI